MFPKNGGTPKSSILIGFSIINHPFWGTTIFGNIHKNSFGEDHPLIEDCIFFSHIEALLLRSDEDTVDGSEIPNNHLGCVNSYK